MKKEALLVFGFFLTCVGFSQNMPFLNYTTHNGLPQIQVRELFQDMKGYIWVGTKGGIAKFNGEQFEIYLPNEYIYFIGEEPLGDVIVLSRNGLYRYSRGEMKQIAKIEGSYNVLVGSGKIWLYDHRIIHEYRNDTLYIDYNLLKDNPADSINSLVYRPENDGFYFTTRKTKSVFYLENGTPVQVYHSDDGIVQAGVFKNGKMFYCIISPDNFSYINPVNGSEFFHYMTRNNRIEHISVSHLPVDHYIVFSEFNYYLIDSATNRSSKLEFPFIKAPWPVLCDRDHNFWIGSDNGLYQVSNSPFRVYPRDFLNDFWTMIKGDDGYFYGAVYQQGLYKLDMVKQLKTEILSFDKNGIKDSAYYYGASKDINGSLYFPTHYGTIKYNYRKAKKIDTGTSLISKYDPFSNRIIIGQEHGIAFIDKNEQIDIFKDSTGTIVNLHPTSLGFEPSGDIWVGTWLTLAKFNREKGIFIPVSELYKNHPESGVVSMASDYKKNIWMGGTNELWLFDTYKNEFIQFGSNLFNTYISSIVSPDSSLLLIGTSYEIYILNLRKFYSTGKLELKMFNFRNGFVAEETSQNGFLVDNGLVYIPSTTVTSVLDIGKISFEPDFYNVLITKVNGIGIKEDERGEGNYFRLKRNDNRLEFSYESVGFGLPTKDRFRYILEGVDKNWSEWGNNRIVSYSNLASGKYCFRVMTKNGSVTENSQTMEDKINILVTLPYYNEPYFYKYAFFVIILLAIVTGYLVFKWFKTKIKIAQREKQIKFFEMATLQAQLNPHFIFNSLSTVQNLISQNKPELANGYLVKFSRLMRAYMESSIKSAQVLSEEVKNENLLKDEIDLLCMYTDLEKIKYAEGKIQCHIETENEALKNRIIPPMLIQPFVENAIKHGLIPKEGPGIIDIHFSESEEGLVCTVYDNGIGRVQSQKLTENSIKPYKSRGMELIQKRIEILNQLGSKVNIQIEDPEQGGTLVKIIIKD
jgi:two-component sensor histidine kinase